CSCATSKAQADRLALGSRSSISWLVAVESLAGTFQVFNSENRHPVRFGRGVARRGALAHPTLLRRRPMLPAVISVRAGKPASASRLSRPGGTGHSPRGPADSECCLYRQRPRISCEHHSTGG